MSVSVLLKLLNELRKREKLQAFGFSKTNLINSTIQKQEY